VQWYAAALVIRHLATHWICSLKTCQRKQSIPLIDHYNGQQGGTLGFEIASAVFAGYSATLQDKVRVPPGIEWFYAEKLDVSSVIAGISTVTVKLIGEMR
jgi:hypothetical protein